MKTRMIVLFCFLSVALFASNNKIDKTREAKAREWLNNQRLEFTENKGQFTDTDGKPAENVLFKATYGSCDIYITMQGLSYVFYRHEGKEACRPARYRERNPGGKVEENQTVSYYRLDMNFEGASIDKANVIREEESGQGTSNYFLAHCPAGIYGVKGYGKITIKNIYQGIDWVIYTNADSKEHPLKYDFVVHPQADYKNIRMKFENAGNTTPR